jgi:hypothetical protein
MRVFISALLLTAFFITFSCIMEGPFPKPDVWVLITNAGSFPMDVSVVVPDVEETDHITVQVDDTEVHEVFFEAMPSCSSEDYDFMLRATYVDETLTYGGLYEEEYRFTDSRTMNITIDDCPGWY